MWDFYRYIIWKRHRQVAIVWYTTVFGQINRMASFSFFEITTDSGSNLNDTQKFMYLWSYKLQGPRLQAINELILTISHYTKTLNISKDRLVNVQQIVIFA